MDVLYVKGAKSINNDLEMLYSLRSLEDNVVDFNRVFISGCLPDFIDEKKITYIPVSDVGFSMTNIWLNIQETIKRTDISKDFCVMYDDIFFTNTAVISSYPFYRRGVLGKMRTGDTLYRMFLSNTKKWLQKNGYPFYDYELHTPCIYNKDNFLKMQDILSKTIENWEPLSCRSIYANMFCPEQPYRKDIKVRTRYQKVPIDTECFSVSDEAFKYKTLDYLKQKYNRKGYFEK